MKYAGSLEALFLDLKTDPKPSVGNFWKDVTYAILAVDQQGHKFIWTSLYRPVLTLFGCTTTTCLLSPMSLVILCTVLGQRIFSQVTKLYSESS